MQQSPLIVITGASQGIGKALAIAFAKEKCALLLISRHIEPLPELKEFPVIYAQVDVIDFNGLKNAISNAESKYGKTECIINNAGFVNVGDFRDMPQEQCAYEFDVLVKGV